jgi:catechol 2,3-dioxygenase-like lactoylglutathione lyase family enzyme
MPFHSAAGREPLSLPPVRVDGALERTVMTIEFKSVIPTFRIFSLEKAREFYVDFLGFKIDWEHRFEPDLPVYMQVSRGDLKLHLSEHHGDGTPGSVAFVMTNGVEALQRELIGKKYRHNRPGLEKQDWGMTTVQVVDPFNNRITFGEPTEKDKSP